MASDGRPASSPRRDRNQRSQDLDGQSLGCRKITYHILRWCASAPWVFPEGNPALLDKMRHCAFVLSGPWDKTFLLVGYDLTGSCLASLAGDHPGLFWPTGLWNGWACWLCTCTPPVHSLGSSKLRTTHTVTDTHLSYLSYVQKRYWDKIAWYICLLQLAGGVLSHRMHDGTLIYCQ